MSTIDTVQYYPNLLILQYLGKVRAYATVQTQVAPVIMPQVSVQTITFVPPPTSGMFVLSYDGASSTPIYWNDSAATIQAKLEEIPPTPGISGGTSTAAGSDGTMYGGDGAAAGSQGIAFGGSAYGWGLASLTVSGSIASGLLTLTFTGETPPALLMVLVSNTTGSEITITEIDLTLPLAVQAGYNLLGPDLAQGVQLDVIGKYVGVTRTGSGFSAPITLDDADFLQLIRMAIVTNSAGSSLATIQQLLAQFFPAGEILVFDYQNMQMSYLISTSIGSLNLIELYITEGLLPKPMAVALSVIFAPIITTFFGFRTYSIPAMNSSPFNTYSSYSMSAPWLSYADAP